MTAHAKAGDAAPLDEAGTMARVARRDAVAFRNLVDAHALPLRRIAYRMIGDASEAEDVAQEALLRLWEHAARWQATGSTIGAWLTRVAMNLCFDRLRRKKFTSSAEVPDRADDTPGADAVIDAERIRAATATCVKALPERQRAAIVLTYYEDHSNLKAAEAMDMNIKAFESLLLRARTALRTAMVDGGLIARDPEDAA